MSEMLSIDAVETPEPRTWWRRLPRVLLLLVLLFLLALGYLLYARRAGTTGPIVFRNASITTSTGFVREGMTVAVADGRIVFVGTAEDSVPLSLTTARHIDAMSALVSAATFDHSVASPPEALRHTWVGQIFEGAPGDLVISTYIPNRGRRGAQQPRDFLGAVVNGRYYTASELR